MALTFQSGFAGSKTVYGWALDQLGNASGSTWTTLGTSTAMAPTVSVTPSSGTGTPQTFSFKYWVVGGYYTDIPTVGALINSNLSGVNGCVVYYNRPTNTIWLDNDAGTTWLGAMTPGVSGTEQNSQCILNAGQSSVSGSGEMLTLNVALTFQPGFVGTKTVYGWYLTPCGNACGSSWTTLGTWTLVSLASGLPVPANVLPSSGTGITQHFLFQYLDANGYSSIATVGALINSSLSGVNGCVVYYNQPTNTIWLDNDAGTAWLGAMTSGVSGIEQNSQCILNAGLSSVGSAGNMLTLDVALTFQPGFVGSKIMYGWAIDNADNSSGSTWSQLGTWAVASAP